jgi:5-hydroxyisourate hydrolase
VSTLSTHVLDTALGKPAAAIRVTLMRPSSDEIVGSGVTDSDGRVRDFPPIHAALEAGEYRLKFAVGEYFAATKRDAFYTEIVIAFRVAGDAHYHVPLLLSPFGYSTYRGS